MTPRPHRPGRIRGPQHRTVRGAAAVGVLALALVLMAAGAGARAAAAVGVVAARRLGVAGGSSRRWVAAFAPHLTPGLPAGRRPLLDLRRRLVASAAGTSSSSSSSSSDEPTRPPTLPSQEFKPKQSLGQNFLSDQNYVLKICNSLADPRPGGRQVVELGPGPGALTRVLHRRYPEMMCVEIDQRAVALLTAAMPALTVVESDVLQVDWTALAELRGGPLSIIGNLPYHITSQILFGLLDNHRAVRQAVVTMQLEVAQRIIAPPRCKDYGILSVLFQLYTAPRINFKIPPTVFYPQPKVTSALITLDFLQPAPGSDGPLLGVDPADLKQVLSLSFQQRRKMLRQSLKGLLAQRGLPPLSDEWATRRPEELEPHEFVTLTRLLFGAAGSSGSSGSGAAAGFAAGTGTGEEGGGSTRVWRRARHGGFEDEDDDEEEED